MSEWEFFDENLGNAKIKVFGVGGGGGNAVKHMIDQKIEGADFISINTDKQALDNIPSSQKLILGENITNGMGAGADPEIGRLAALEDRDRLKELIKGADMVFIASGMGGGTGTGASPIVAQVAKELGALTVAIVTKPFSLEGKRKMSLAQEGINQMVEEVDSLITIPNQKLLEVLGKGCTMVDGFKAANDVLAGAVRGISDIIIKPGMINVDFADVKTIMSEMGLAMMGSGTARGEHRAKSAAEAAISSPLLDNVNLAGARGVLVNITAGMDMSISEFEEVGDAVKGFTSDDAVVIVGTVIDPDMSDELRVTLVATGLGKISNKEAKSVTTTTKTSKFDKQVMSNKNYRNNKLETSSQNEQNMDYLDIPAFLRRQAD